MSSSFKYTFTKLRSFPSSVKRCLRSSACCVVRPLSASPTVCAETSAESFFAAYTRNGVGIITFTAMFFSVEYFINSCELRPFSNRCAAVDFDFLRQVRQPIVIQPPGSHLRRLAAHHAHDDVAVPRPSVLAVKLAGPGRMIGMRMIPAHDLHALFSGHSFGVAHILRGHRKPVARRIVAPVHQRKQTQNFARRSILLAVFAQQRAATFMRKSLGPVPANAFRQLLADR